MKKEYIKPEAEMMKFVETEEIMTGDAELLEQFKDPNAWATSLSGYKV